MGERVIKPPSFAGINLLSAIENTNVNRELPVLVKNQGLNHRKLFWLKLCRFNENYKNVYSKSKSYGDPILEIKYKKICFLNSLGMRQTFFIQKTEDQVWNWSFSSVNLFPTQLWPPHSWIPFHIFTVSHFLRRFFSKPFETRSPNFFAKWIDRRIWTIFANKIIITILQFVQ